MAPHQILILEGFLGRFPLCLNTGYGHSTAPAHISLTCSSAFLMESALSQPRTTFPFSDLLSTALSTQGPDPVFHMPVSHIFFLYSQAVQWGEWRPFLKHRL